MSLLLCFDTPTSMPAEVVLSVRIEQGSLCLFSWVHKRDSRRPSLRYGDSLGHVDTQICSVPTRIVTFWYSENVFIRTGIIQLFRVRKEKKKRVFHVGRRKSIPENIQFTHWTYSRPFTVLSVLPTEQELIPEYWVNIFCACVRPCVRPSVPLQIRVGCV